MYDINKVGSINLVVQLILPLIAGKVEISACIVGYCSSVLYYVFEANSYWNWGMKNGPISVKFSYNYFQLISTFITVFFVLTFSREREEGNPLNDRSLFIASKRNNRQIRNIHGCQAKFDTTNHPLNHLTTLINPLGSIRLTNKLSAMPFQFESTGTGTATYFA